MGDGGCWGRWRGCSRFRRWRCACHGTAFVALYQELRRIWQATGETLWTVPLQSSTVALSLTPTGDLIVAEGSGIAALRFATPLAVSPAAWATWRGNLEHSGRHTPP